MWNLATFTQEITARTRDGTAPMPRAWAWTTAGSGQNILGARFSHLGDEPGDATGT